MRTHNTTLLNDEPLAESTTVTPKVDCWSLDVGSFTAVLAGIDGSIDVSLQLEVSDAPAPSTSTTWEPPEASWFGVGEATPVTNNGPSFLKFDGFIGARWARLKATKNTGTGGTMTVTCFLKGLG